VNILFLSRWYPFPPTNGSKIRVFNLLRQLQRRHEVSLLSFVEPTDCVDGDGFEAAGLARSAVRVVVRRPYRPTSARAVAGLFSMQPRHLVDTYSVPFAQAVDEHLRTRHVDLVIASEIDMMPYGLRAAHASDVPVLLEELEIATFRDAAHRRSVSLQKLRNQLTWAKLGAYLRHALPRFEACTVVSQAERRYLAQVAPGYQNVHVVPNAVDVDSYVRVTEPPEADSLVFAGALTYSANFLGADWFLRHVQPLLTQRVPTAHVRITGGTDGVNLAAFPRHAGYELTGYVPDIQRLIARSMVSIVPLQTGGGTRLKILESMALGTPVVSTTKGAEGLDVSHGENILIADDPAAFAGCVESILRDPSLRARLAERGRQLVRARYDWDAVGPAFCSLAEAAAKRGAATTSSVARV
jgi:glycosyltransferase involved in cell wall biosynthesis